ncbi:MAG: MBL fold metallo-hydrolase [Proteobacteria bacterium]|nr:MBL fold metallo-hydrolase [Pseudomonadota bacterium]
MVLEEVDKLEILTLQDNYIDLVQQDNSSIVQRAMPLVGMEFKNSILAEHGFSALITVTKGNEARTLLFDFGLSEMGAAFNAESLNADLPSVEVLVLSHGHPDHVGGFEKLRAAIGERELELVLHPGAFRNPRYIKITEEFKVVLPSRTREGIAAAGVRIVECREPKPLLDGMVLFLGEIPRSTSFETGAPNLFYEENGTERQDLVEDDTSLVVKVKNRGLVVISGCAHSGIVNTVKYARHVAGIDGVHAVMGGFHLTGADQDPIIAPTIRGLKEIGPDHVVPTHCTGRKAVAAIERAMPDQCIINMAGTRLTFAA